MMMLSTKNEKAPPRTSRGRGAPQRSWKSSSDLPQRSVGRWESMESLSSAASSTSSRNNAAPPMRPPRRNNSDSSSEVDLDEFDATDHGDDDDDVDSSDEEEQEPLSPLKGDGRAADLTLWKSSDSLPRLHEMIPSLSRPSRQGPSSPHRGGLARWKSTSECIQRSSIPEDSELLTICKRHPADDTKDEDDSLTKPKRRNSLTQNEAPEEDNDKNDDANEAEMMPTPVMLMRRNRSEAPRRGQSALLQMQHSLRDVSQDGRPQAALPSTSREGPPQRSGSSRPTPPRRAPSRSVSERVSPLQRSLTRHTSMIQRRPSSSAAAAGGDLMTLRKAVVAAAAAAQSIPSPVSVQDVAMDAATTHI